MKPTKYIQFLFLLTVCTVFHSCNSAGGGFGRFNWYSVDQDIKLGLQLSRQIENDPVHFPILPEAGNEEVYEYLRGIRDTILNSGHIKYRDVFKWDLKVIDDRETLNAFVTPGGYIYIYLGLILYLDSEDQLAGVLGHEIAHADRRHSTRQMTKSGLISSFGQAILGEASALSDIAGSLVTLKFSRKHEEEADEFSVRYLCGTGYNAAGAAGFFRKIENVPGDVPNFLRTHPDPGNRVEKIEQVHKELSCPGQDRNNSKYQRIKRLLQ